VYVRWASHPFLFTFSFPSPPSSSLSLSLSYFLSLSLSLSLSFSLPVRVCLCVCVFVLHTQTHIHIINVPEPPDPGHHPKIKEAVEQHSSLSIPGPGSWLPQKKFTWPRWSGGNERLNYVEQYKQYINWSTVQVYAYLYRAINKNVFVNCDKEVKSTGNYV